MATINMEVITIRLCRMILQAQMSRMVTIQLFLSLAQKAIIQSNQTAIWQSVKTIFKQEVVSPIGLPPTTILSISGMPMLVAVWTIQAISVLTITEPLLVALLGQIQLKLIPTFFGQIAVFQALTSCSQPKLSTMLNQATLLLQL